MRDCAECEAAQLRCSTSHNKEYETAKDEGRRPHSLGDCRHVACGVIHVALFKIIWKQEVLSIY